MYLKSRFSRASAKANVRSGRPATVRRWATAALGRVLSCPVRAKGLGTAWARRNVADGTRAGWLRLPDARHDAARRMPDGDAKQNDHPRPTSPGKCYPRRARGSPRGGAPSHLGEPGICA